MRSDDTVLQARSRIRSDDTVLQARSRMRSDDKVLSDQDVLNIGRGLINTRDSSSSRTENIKVTASRFTPLPSISSSDSEDSSKASVTKIIKEKKSHI